MTDDQWNQLLRVLDGEWIDPPPVAFLVDAPWIAAIGQISLLEYFTDTSAWCRANLAAVERFPQVWWLPGFWAEFGMISNPPSFGAKCIWPEEGFPTCDTVLRTCGEIADLRQPDVRTDGLLPLIMQRMRQSQAAVEAAGHRLRFACSHGPITIASYLLGHNTFFLACRTEPNAIQQLVDKTTRFVTDWLKMQQATFASIDGVLVLEDLMGFVGRQDFEALVLPAMKRVFAALPVSVRFLHNDAFGLITAEYLHEMRVNLFNFSFEHSFQQVRSAIRGPVTLMGNIPPRDVLGAGSEQSIGESVRELRAELFGERHVILSAGGFTPSAFSTEKVEAFCRAAGRGGR